MNYTNILKIVISFLLVNQSAAQNFDPNTKIMSIPKLDVGGDEYLNVKLRLISAELISFEQPSPGNIEPSITDIHLPHDFGVETLEIRNTNNSDIIKYTISSPSGNWLRVNEISKKDSTGTSYIIKISFDKNNGKSRSANLVLTKNQNSPINIFLSQSASETRVPVSNYSEGPHGFSFEYESFLSANRPYSYSVVEAPLNPIRFGHSSERFELRHGDCGGQDCGRSDGSRERSEVSQNGDQNLEGKTYWYGWSMYVPHDFPEVGNIPGTSKTQTFAQFHQNPLNPDSGWYPAWMFGKEFNGDFIVRSFPTYNNPPYVSNSYKLIDKNYFTSRWHDFLVNSKWSTRSDGFMKIWVNGVKKVDYNGPTMSPNNKWVYFKYGAYRPSDTNNLGSTVIYFDEIRRGNQRSDVDILSIDLD